MHTPFNPESIDWSTFLDSTEQQTGSGYATFVQQYGEGGGAVGYSYFEGVPYQRGAGFGSVFRSLFRALVPLGKQAASAVGREGLATAARVLQNAVQQQHEQLDKNNNPTMNWKENIMRETHAGVSNLLDQAATHMRKQRGSGARGKKQRKSPANAKKKSIKANSKSIFPTSSPLLFSRKGPGQRGRPTRVDSLGVY